MLFSELTWRRSQTASRLVVEVLAGPVVEAEAILPVLADVVGRPEAPGVVDGRAAAEAGAREQADALVGGRDPAAAEVEPHVARRARRRRSPPRRSAQPAWTTTSRPAGPGRRGGLRRRRPRRVRAALPRRRRHRHARPEHGPARGCLPRWRHTVNYTWCFRPPDHVRRDWRERFGLEEWAGRTSTRASTRSGSGSGSTPRTARPHGATSPSGQASRSSGGTPR